MAAAKSEPKITEVNVNVRHGGKVQIIKFDVSSDYSVSVGRTYSIPEDWTDEQAEAFEAERLAEIREIVDTQANIEFDERWEQSYLS